MGLAELSFLPALFLVPRTVHSKPSLGVHPCPCSSEQNGLPPRSQSGCLPFPVLPPSLLGSRWHFKSSQLDSRQLCSWKAAHQTESRRGQMAGGWLGLSREATMSSVRSPCFKTKKAADSPTPLTRSPLHCDHSCHPMSSALTPSSCTGRALLAGSGQPCGTSLQFGHDRDPGPQSSQVTQVSTSSLGLAEDSHV